MAVIMVMVIMVVEEDVVREVVFTRRTSKNGCKDRQALLGVASMPFEISPVPSHP